LPISKCGGSRIQFEHPGPVLPEIQLPLARHLVGSAQTTGSHGLATAAATPPTEH
tara:strand:+ start:199 stop:363 length:165 start_codon:yes stop_codon:yes gene_type:complete